MTLWIVLVSVDLDQGVLADTEEEALIKAQTLIDKMFFEEPINNVTLTGVIKY